MCWSLPIASWHLLCTCHSGERRLVALSHFSFSFGNNSRDYSSLAANKLELKIKIAGIPAIIQVTSMGASPTFLLLAAAHGVPWLACACRLAIRVCHLFTEFKCLQT